MFNRIYQRINIALPKFLVALLVGLLLPPVSSITSVQILSPASAVAANPNPVCTASTCTVTFNTSTDFFTYTTPLANVTFAVRGGQGSANGGIVSGTLNAAAGTVLTIYVGAAASGSTGGKSGGRNSGGSGATTNSSYNGVGGGGHSEIVIAGNSAVIAGGGGGNGGWSGGAGGIGGSTRASDTLFSGASGGAGQAQGGTGGSSSGGGGGAGNGANSGTNGSAGLGGNGGYNALINGGGGGGGYFGGGGGGADSNSCCADGGGGGGGSSFVNATYISGLATFTSGNSGGGSVVISYPASYTVSFNANSGSGSPSVASVSQTSAGASVTLAGAGNLNRSGFTLAGWNTNETGTGTSYSLGQSLVPTSTLTLYAQWNSFIQYSANGATSGSPPDSTTARTALGATTLATNTRTLARTNYTFGGWNTNETGTGTSFTLPNTTYASTGNTTLFARWDSVITYLGNGSTSGSVPATTTMFGASGTLASNTGTLAKTVSSKTFTFGGWNTNETGTGTAYAVSASYPPTGNRSLYAQWNTVVTYNGNSNTGGSVPSNTTITGISGNLATNSGNLVNGTKVFAGWNTNSAGTGTRYSSGASFTNSGNITLFAQWVNALTLTGSSSISVAQGSAFRSDTYTATNGLETKTVTYSLTPNNAGITLETSTAGATTNAFIRISATVAGGTYIDTLTATDAMGVTATLAVTVRVDSPIRWSAANGNTVTTTYGRSASLRLDTTNGFSNRVYTLTHVSSPSSSGITLDTTTAASQYVTLNVSSTVLPGTYLESVTATDSSGTRVTTTITVIVNQPIIVSKDSSIVAATFGSMSFNGSSNYVSYTGAAPSLQIGNTYTIEWWQYQTDNSSWTRVFSLGGSSFGVSIEGNSFYYWTGSANLMGTSNVNRKNKWTHFALVSNNGNMMVYQDGIALSATAKAVATLNSSSVPNAANLCIASQCAGGGTFFGGNIANLIISKRLDYSGTSTSGTNFTPTSQIRVDSTTVLALTNFIGSNTFTDLSSSARSAANYFSSTGSTMYPTASGANLVEVTTTQGLAVTSSAFTATNGSGNKTFTMTSNYAPASIAASSNSATVSISSAATANSSSQARITYETLTVTDTASSTLTVPLKLTINPPVSLSATTLTLTTSAGIAAYDTVTATFGTGTKTFSVVSSSSVAGISYSSPSTNTYLMTVSKTVPQGTYIETITARDSLGSTTSVVITVTVAPGLSLVSASGVNTLQTTFGRATSLRLDAQNGSGTRTFTLTQIGTTSAGITLNVSTASSGYATLNIANTVAVGSYTDSITVTDTSGGRFSLSISVTVNAAQTLSYGGATSGTISLATTAGKTLRSNAFTAALGTGTRTLTISGRNSAISIDTSTANLGYLNLGSALTAGTYYETVTATDAAGSTTLRSITVTVNPAITLVATPISLTTTTGVAITDTVTATNGTGSKTFSLSVSPTVAGITFTNTVLDRAVITVANTVSTGSYTITLTATDSVSAITLINIPLLVNASLVINGPVALSSTAGYAFTSPTYLSSGGSGNTVYSVSGATGVRLSASSGTPTLIVPDTVTAATYNLTLRITDSVTATTTLAITLTVNPPVSLNGNKTLSKVYGEELTQVYQTNSGTAPFSLFASSICTTEKSTDGGYTVEKFAGTGSCTWNVPTGVSSLTVLTVAGGGGGGAAGWAGGGGAGGVVYVPNYSVTPNQNVSVEVGTGGNGGSNDTTCTSGSSPSQGSNGGNSSFNSTFTAIGGGGGGGYGWSGRTGCGSGKQGGNGGGSGETDYTPTIATSIQGIFSSANSYGNSGGRTTFLSGIQAGSGGGGAAAVGGSTSSSSRDRVAGAGGAGVSISITGSPVVYAGGGGGGTCRPCGNTPEGNVGVGGSGGGGSGGNNESSAGGGTNGLGGGGGGAQTGSGGKGGSGTVIVRYLTPTADSATTVLTMTTLRTTPTGSLQLNAPRNLPVLPNSGKYTQTITVTDASGSTGSTPVTIELTVIKATPSLSLSIPGGGTTATYGSPVSLTATSTTAGRFNFIRATTSISGCNEKTTSNGVATCSWTPTDTSTAIISAIFTPTDTTNYNSATSSTLTLTIAQADTLTVTFSPQVLTFTGTAAVISRAYTLNGLTSIDSITAVSTLVTGTANDSTSYNSATSPTKAGTYSLTGTAVTFSGSARASYYRSIVYIPGAITIERAANVISFNYGSSNTVVYRPTGVETVTAAFLGDGATTYSSADTVYCSLNSANGDLTTVQAGSCDISLGVAQGTNHLGDTVTATVTINRAPRTISVTSVANSLKYGETTTVTTAISFDGLDGVITYSNGVTTGCTFNSSDGLLTATSGTATCSIVASITDGINYQSATSSSLTITLNKADAPVVTLVAPANIDYSPTATSSDMERPTFTISGLQFTDTATALSDLTVTYVASGTYSYNNVTVPTGANTYSLTPSALVLSVGSISNYQTPSYVPANWTINKIAQAPLTATSLLQEGITVPFDIQYSGGTTNGTVSLTITAGGSATGCTRSGLNLQASSTGTCIIQLTMAGNQNYFEITSETITVTIANFIQSTFNFDNFVSGSTGITITSEVPIVVDVISCSADCVPTISGISPTAFQAGDIIVITGTDFASATEIIFNRSVFVTSFQIDSNDQITVLVPSGLTISANGSISVKNGSKISNRVSGLTITG